MRNWYLSLWLSFAALSCAAPSSADELIELEERALRAAVARVAPSVVSIETVGGLETVGKLLVGQGPTTGLIVSSDGYIVSSAYNFVQKPTSILVGFADRSRAPAKIVATDRSRMLVLLKVSIEQPLPVAEAIPAGELKVGQWSIAVGRTFDGQVNSSVGVVSALDRIWGKAIQTDAKISPNNYGGPLVDIRGRVAGVLVPLSPQATGEMAGVDWYDSGIGFAIAMPQVDASVARLKSGGDLFPGILGVVTKPADMFADPVELNGVRPNSPAYKAGLKRGDRIVSIDGREIVNRAQMTRAVNKRYAGDALKIVVKRGDEQLERSLELIDKLDPYARPALGILPRRDPRGKDDPRGVVVRYVYPDSAAAKGGIQVDDRLVKLGQEPIVDRDSLATLLADLEWGKELTIEVLREGKSKTLTIKPEREPHTVPEKLPLAAAKLDTPPQNVPPLGKQALRLAEHKTQFHLYVPQGYDARLPPSLLVSLNGLERVDVDQTFAAWGPLCDANNVLLMLPIAAEGQWQMDDMEAIGKALEELPKSYTIDPQRVAVHGLQAGGVVAQRLLGAPARERIRGVSLAQAPIVTPPPDNDPAFPLSWLVATSKTPDLTAGLTALKNAKFAVTEQSQGEKGRPLNDAEREVLLRWLDTLDRL